MGRDTPSVDDRNLEPIAMIAHDITAQNAQEGTGLLARSPSAPPQAAVSMAVGSVLVLVDPQDATELVGRAVEHFGSIGLLDDEPPPIEEVMPALESPPALPGATPRFLDCVPLSPLPVEHADLLDALEQAAATHAIAEVVQFGCGRGEVLRPLVQRGVFASACGIDANAGRIEAARRSVIDPRVHFASGHALDWTLEFGWPCNAYFSLGGVLESLTVEQLRLLFGQMALRLRPAVIAFTESATHPYERLLREAGFSVLQQTDKTVDGLRKITLVAKAA
jgi:hypothetical protein